MTWLNDITDFTRKKKILTFFLPLIFICLVVGTDFGYWMSEKLQVPFEIDKYAQYPMNMFEGSFKLERTPKLEKQRSRILRGKFTKTTEAR